MMTSEVNYKFKNTTLDVGDAVERGVGCRKKRGQSGKNVRKGREKAPRRGNQTQKKKEKKEEKHFSFSLCIICTGQAERAFPLDLHVRRVVVFRGMRSCSYHRTLSDAASRLRLDAAMSRVERSRCSQQTAGSVLFIADEQFAFLLLL